MNGGWNEDGDNNIWSDEIQWGFLKEVIFTY